MAAEGEERSPEELREKAHEQFMLALDDLERAHELSPRSLEERPDVVADLEQLAGVPFEDVAARARALLAKIDATPRSDSAQPQETGGQGGCLVMLAVILGAATAALSWI